MMTSKSEVVHLRLLSGEDIIGTTIIEEASISNNPKLDKPLQLIIFPPQPGQPSTKLSYGFAPFMPMTVIPKEGVTFNTDLVLFRTRPAAEIEKEYLKMVTGIEKVSPPPLIIPGR
jgi:hypothetical protein